MESWLEKVGRIQPASVQIYSLDEVDEARGLEPLKPYELLEIAEKVTNRFGVKAEASWPPVTWLR